MFKIGDKVLALSQQYRFGTNFFNNGKIFTIDDINKDKSSSIHLCYHNKSSGEYAAGWFYKKEVILITPLSRLLYEID
jgi:hypothetical protein